MSNPVGQVSIKLSNLDEEGESSKLKEDGGHRSPSTVAAKRPKLEEVVINAYHPQPKIFLPKWEIIFTVASAFAVFVDPFCCYVPVIIDHSTSYTWDETLLWTIFALRSAGDQFYGMDILVFIKRRRDNVNAKPFGASWTKYFGGPDSTIRKVLNGQKSLRFLGIVPRICAALPILQAFLVVGLKTDLVRLYQQLLYLIAFQYILRAYNFYRWLDQHANIETAVKRFLKAALDFLPFILAAHLFGALWYYFAVDQKIAYWEEHCRKFDGKFYNDSLLVEACWDYFDGFYCSSFTPKYNKMFNVSHLHESCAV